MDNTFIGSSTGGRFENFYSENPPCYTPKCDMCSRKLMCANYQENPHSTSYTCGSKGFQGCSHEVR